MNKQNLKGNIGYAAGHVAVQNMHINVGEREAANDEPLLVPAQRSALNTLVRQLADVSKQESRQIWTELHAELGVRSIKEITTGQFGQARKFLVRRIAEEQEATVCNTLIHTILKAVDAKDARLAMVNHCMVSYGITHLKSLRREQLQDLLCFVQQYPHRPLRRPWWNWSLSKFKLLRRSLRGGN